MDTRIPFLVLGDGPRLPSGLARIARDLTARLVAEEEQLGIRVAQIGIDYPGGWHWGGWPFYGFQEHYWGYGRKELSEATRDLQLETGQRPIVLAITDPARLYDSLRPAVKDEPTPVMDLWGYLPIDAHNVSGAIGGPAAQAVWWLDRVLAYGAYGAGVLKKTLAQQQAQTPGLGRMREQRLGTPKPVSYLPHGLEPVFRPNVPLGHADPLFQQWRRDLPPDYVVIGAVATNQPRKDLGLLFAAVAELKAQGRKAALWLHTDTLTKTWDVGQLATDFAYQRYEVLATVSAEELTDEQLAARYCASHATVAPGLGEGFCYPVCESLACNTPVVHGDYAGAPELISERGLLVEPVAYRLDSCYCLQRPVFNPKHVAATLRWAIDQPAAWRGALSGSVAHLHWGSLWPRWKQWIEQGLRARRGQTT